jgi:hypothetical protein
MAKINVILPSCVTPEQRKKPSPERYRHAFKDGHTDDDAEYVLGPMSKITGLNLVLIFAFTDAWSTGGDSNMAVLQDGKLYECPDPILEFLYEGEGGIADLTQKFKLERGEYKGKRKLPEPADDGLKHHVYVWENCPDKEMD